MADKFYSVDLGGKIPSQVTEGSATSGKVIEVRVSDTVYSNKMAVLLGLEAIEDYITTKETNPIA